MPRNNIRDSLCLTAQIAAHNTIIRQLLNNNISAINSGINGVNAAICNGFAQAEIAANLGEYRLQEFLLKLWMGIWKS